MGAKHHLRKLGSALCLIVGLAAFGSGFAQDASPVQITSTFFQQVEVTEADGSVTTRLMPATKVVPGGEVIYEVAYGNRGPQQATGVVINGPVPASLVFLHTEQTPATDVSVDGGEHYGQLADLTVPGMDGKPRPAVASDVTNVRWVLPRLAPGASGKVSYRARVK